MRVSLVDPSAFTPPYDRSLAAALARAGADVELVTSRFLYGPVPKAEGYRVREPFYRRSTAAGLQSRRRLPLKALEHPAQILREGRRAGREADVTHWQWVTLPRIDRFLVRASGHPRLLTLHYPLPKPPDRRGLAAQRRFLSEFDAVVSHTEHGARRLRDDVGLDPSRVHVIPHGPLDYLTELPAEEPLPAELAAAPEGAPVVLFFGLLRPYKGIDTLLEAFARLGPAAEGAELWIAGMPRMPIEPLRELAARAPGTVRFVPRFISDPEVPPLLRRADVLALPYREIEQSGVLYAGLAFGKPMVLGDVGGFSEVGRDQGAARLVPPADPGALAAALTDLVADPAERERLSAAARKAIEGPYGWDSIAARTLELYESLMAPARPAPDNQSR
ncbi:MAG TPA: glycosyltransferase family 4 protein [Solirubrobacterales bacterium]|nr:glycosyltransferase family 4 protein [Solirubrobacterales bacterium]